MDITDFVQEQKKYLDNNKLEKLLIPKERIIKFENAEINKGLGIEQ
jgi:hypothetical protein